MKIYVFQDMVEGYKYGFKGQDLEEAIGKLKQEVTAEMDAWFIGENELRNGLGERVRVFCFYDGLNHYHFEFVKIIIK